MKIRTAHSMFSAGGIAGVILLGSTLLFAQDGKGGAGGALSTDPFVKKRAAGVGAGAGDPFSDNVSTGGGGAAADPFADSGGGAGTRPRAAVDDPFGGGREADPNDPFGPAAGDVASKLREVVEPVALLEYIRTDLATANELLHEFGGVEDATPLRARLEKMLEVGEAELVETSFLRTESGQRMTTESMREHLYPTEFNVPNSPERFDGKRAPMPIASACPNAFEMRPVGTVVQIDATVGAGEAGERYVNVNIAPEIVRYLGDRSMAPGGTAEHRIQMVPEFATMRIQTEVVIREGATSLLGVLKETPDEQGRVFVLLRADTLRSDLPEPWGGGNDASSRIVNHFEWVRLGHREANKLLNEGFNQRDASKMRASLQAMIEGGDAQLVESVYLKSLPGQRAKSESVREHMYATGFDPPELPNDLTIDGTTVRPTGATPTSIDVRKVGTTVELEAVVDRLSSTVAVNIAAELVEHLGDRQLVENPPEEVANVILPDFYRMGLTTNIRCFFGQPNLIGVLTPHGDPGQRVLLFVKTDVVR